MKKYSLAIVALISVLFISSCKTLNSSSDYSFNSSSQYSQSSSLEESSIHIHNFELVNQVPATLFESGMDYFQCKGCSETKQEITYELNQCAFEDQTYMYDGLPHSVNVQGLLPDGISVEYANNTLTEIGEQEATVSYFNTNHELVKTDTAKIEIATNTGFSNIYVNTNGTVIGEEIYVPMTLSTTNCADKYQLTNFAGGIRIRGNGTASWFYSKKAYRIKFDQRCSMLGVNQEAKAKSWVLLADWADQSMMRNVAALSLGNSLLNYSNNYASGFQHVNLYLNGQYNGVYLLAEQQQANKNRIDIAEPEENYQGTDIGYLLELDSPDYAIEEAYYFAVGEKRVSSTTLPMKYYSIKSDMYNQTQENYINKYITNVYNALFNIVTSGDKKILNENHDLITSPYESAYETLNSMIDIESVVKLYILHELMKTVDVGFSSFYMFVDFSEGSKYPRLTFGAPWDFDWSSGNVNEAPYTTSQGAFNSINLDDHTNPWFYMLSKTNFFNEMIVDYYRIFNNSQVFEHTIDFINYETNAFENEFTRNYGKWDNLGTIVYKYTPNIALTFVEHSDAVNHLTGWLEERKTYLDSVYLV